MIERVQSFGALYEHLYELLICMSISQMSKCHMEESVRDYLKKHCCV